MKRLIHDLTVVCVLMTVLFGNTSAQEKKKSIAVLEFISTGGLAQNEMATLTNRFRGILVNTEKYDVVEREKMNEILKQQDMNISDNCNSAECAVQVGQLLGVEQMIAGDIGKLGQTWTIDLRLLDIETGKIIKTKSQDYRGEIDGMLDIMKSIAGAFAGIQSEAKIEGKKETRIGDIYITSVPSKAEIIMDGKRTGWLTPRLIEGIAIGKHVFEARSGIMLLKREVDVVENQMNNLELTLELPSIAVKFVSEPMGADIFIDGVLKGKTPAVLQVPLGKRQVRLWIPNYTEHKEEIMLDTGMTSKTIMGSLVHRFKVLISSQPPLAKIYVDNKYVGPAPWTDSLSEGTHALRLQMDNGDYDIYKEDLVVNKDIQKVIRMKKSGDEAAGAKKGSVKFWLIAGGLAAAGGGAYFLFLKPKGGSSAIPLPGGFPPNP